MQLLQDLEQYRLEHKLTQQEIAEQLDVAFATVNRWLNGRTRPNKIQEFHINKLVKNGSDKTN